MEKKMLLGLLGLFVVMILAFNYLIITNIQTNNIGNINFETISKGSYSSHKEPGNYVINNVKELKELGLEILEIDLSESTVIAVFMGEFNTGGHAIEIEEIVEKTDKIIVKIDKTFPKPGQPVTQALTQPYHIVKIEKINKKVVF